MPPSHTANTSAVTLVRTSQAWSQADSAAGFVLRYLAPDAPPTRGFIEVNRAG